MAGRKLEKEFLEKIRTNQGIINKICFVYASNKEEQKDFSQEIILQLWKSYPGFKGHSNFSTWMYKVALNTVISIVKKPGILTDNQKKGELSFDMEQSLEYSEEINLLYKAISNLNKIEKALILMWLEEYSYDEIANTLGISVKNVSVKLVRIKTKLADLIKKLQ